MVILAILSSKNAQKITVLHTFENGIFGIFRFSETVDARFLALFSKIDFYPIFYSKWVPNGGHDSFHQNHRSPEPEK